MDSPRFLQCLATDQLRLREVAAHDLTATVPTCPEWDVAALVEHVALVYLHKVECMRTKARVEWPPPAEPRAPLDLLDQSYATLLGELAQRSPDEPSYTWYSPEPTVSFWIRRMAQETVIHRVDAELALGEPVAPIPDDLALDGIDEVLERFLGYFSRQYPAEFGADLAEAGGSTVLVTAADRGWLVRMEPSGVVVEPAAPDAAATGRLTGDPQDVLLWLWRRTSAGAIGYDGDPAALGRLRDLLGTATE